MMTTNVYPESSEVFQQRIMNTVKSAFTVPCIALGSKLGLFDKMAEFTQPITSQELADAMDYKERYVREWLDAMVCIRVFDYDVSDKTYIFPGNRHFLFTEKTGNINATSWAEGLPIMLMAYPELQKCFRNHGPSGIPYDVYTGFHEWRELRSVQVYTGDHIKRIFQQEPGLLKKLERGIRVCDIGCGTGNQSRQIAKLFPNSSCHGCDISAHAIQCAKQLKASESDQSNNSNLSFSVQDTCNLPADWSESFDLIVAFGVIHDLAYASRGLEQIHRCLKRGGLFYMMDPRSTDDPVKNNSVLYFFSLFPSLPQSLLHDGSEGLGMMWGSAKAKKMITAAGFSDVRELEPEPLYMNIMCHK